MPVKEIGEVPTVLVVNTIVFFAGVSLKPQPAIVMRPPPCMETPLTPRKVVVSKMPTPRSDANWSAASPVFVKPMHKNMPPCY